MLLTKVLFLLSVESFDLFSNLASVLSVLVYWTSFCLPEKCQSIGDMKFYFVILWSDVFKFSWSTECM